MNLSIIKAYLQAHASTTISAPISCS